MNRLPDREVADITSRRKPNAEERRRTLCDAAIRLLANEGAKGLSHLKVDREADVPDGSTSFYFRTRSALLLAVAQRMAELDRAALTFFMNLLREHDGVAPQDGPSALARLMIRAAQPPHVQRTRARYELMLEASRQPAVAEVFRPNAELYVELHREIVVRLLPPDVELDDAMLNDQMAATMAFINGVGLELAIGDRSIRDAEQIDRLLAAVVRGVIAAHRDDPMGGANGNRAIG